MTTYVAHNVRDTTKAEVARLTVEDDGKVTQASPTLLENVPRFRRPKVGMGEIMANNRHLAFEEAAAPVQKSHADVYKVTTEQTEVDVGYILVDKATDTLAGYAGNTLPTGYQDGLSLDALKRAGSDKTPGADGESMDDPAEQAELEAVPGRCCRVCGKPGMISNKICRRCRRASASA